MFVSTGPESRPSNAAVATEATENAAEPANEQQGTGDHRRNLQHFFMQRMSDILTQMVTGTRSEPVDDTDTATTDMHTARILGENPTQYDDSSMDDEGDAQPSSPERKRRTFASDQHARRKKRRETERSHEENGLKNVPSLGFVNSYDGHRNTRTMIKEANFWSDSHVMSGSDCG